MVKAIFGALGQNSDTVPLNPYLLFSFIEFGSLHIFWTITSASFMESYVHYELSDYTSVLRGGGGGNDLSGNVVKCIYFK